jgi:hypothetical protein
VVDIPIRDVLKLAAYEGGLPSQARGSIPDRNALPRCSS